MNNFWIYKALVNQAGTDKLVDTLFVLAQNMFDATHISTHEIYDDDSKYLVPVEIVGIQRLTEIPNVILNLDILLGNESEDEEEYTGKEPLEFAKNMGDEQCITFKCGQCKEELRVANGTWPFVLCSNCGYKMERRYIKNAGGYYFYEEPKGNK